MLRLRRHGLGGDLPPRILGQDPRVGHRERLSYHLCRTGKEPVPVSLKGVHYVTSAFCDHADHRDHHPDRSDPEIQDAPRYGAVPDRHLLRSGLRQDPCRHLCCHYQILRLDFRLHWCYDYFGAVIASGINDTGAATSMVNFFIKKFKGKCLELAPSLTGFIMSIPVFGDIAIILNAPISAILAKRKKLGMQQVAPFVNLGLTLTHGLVPPPPASWLSPSCWALTSALSLSSASSAPSSPSLSATSACVLSTPRASTSLPCPSTPRALRLWKTPTM